MKTNEIIVGKMQSGAVLCMPKNRELINTVLREFINCKKMLGVYLTTIQPYNEIIETLKNNKINDSCLFFLDFTGKESIGNEHVFVFQDATDLTELSVVITEVMENKGIGFLIIDAMSGLETYVETANTKKFIRALVSYMKKLNKTLVILDTGAESEELRNFVKQLSDYHKE